MTEPTIAMTAEPKVADDGAAPRRRTWIVLLTVVALTASAWFSWSAATHRTADQVLIRWAQESPTCTGARVRPGRIDPFEDTGPERAAIVAGPGMACTVTVEILNGSDDEIRVDRLIAPMVGPGTGSVVKVDPELHPQPDVDPLSSEALGDRDAVIDVDTVIDAGAETAVEVRLVFNPHGCLMGGTAWTDGWPTVELTTMGRTSERPAADTYAISHRGRTPGCRGM